MDYGEIGRSLFREHAEGMRFHSLDPQLGVASQEDAYAVQGHYVSLLKKTSGEVAGYKVGLTSKRMQAMCGIDSPVAGVVLANRVHKSGVKLNIANFGRVGVEFEIGVLIGRDAIVSTEPFTQETIASSVSGVCAAVEVVDDRNADYSVLSALSLIADNSWNAGVILGDWRKDWPPLNEVKGRVSVDGEEVDSGYGRDVLGHPFVPLAWLANHLAGQGARLRAGDIVLTGSLVVTRFPKEPGAYRYELAGIGAVNFQIEG